MMQKSKAEDLIGCCGLYCGLCNKYQSTAPSRCIGCITGEQHSWCSIWNCCVKKHGFDNCAGCSDVFKCTVHTRRKVAEWIPAADNLCQIQASSSVTWLEEQKERQSVLEELLQNYNEGRSMSFYCKVCAAIPVDSLRQAIKKAKAKFKSEQVGNSDLKTKARMLKDIIDTLK